MKLYSGLLSTTLVLFCHVTSLPPHLVGYTVNKHFTLMVSEHQEFWKGSAVGSGLGIPYMVAVRWWLGLPTGKESAYSAGDTRDTASIPGRSPGGGKWQPTLIVWPGESHRQRSLVGYIPKGCKESDTTERQKHPQVWLELEQSGVHVAGDSCPSLSLFLSPYSLKALARGLSMWTSFSYLASWWSQGSGLFIQCLRLCRWVFQQVRWELHCLLWSSL